MGRECIILLQLIEKQGPGTRDLSGAFCLLLVNADIPPQVRNGAFLF